MNAPTDPTRCPLCGQSNQCIQANPATADQPCWCFEVRIAPEQLKQVPEQDLNRACLCPRCAHALPTDAPS
ncbi:cysteine-rich CWC family protein [Metapseudomonas boanensis]|uniref:Cysteine-rich CWC family protein n=1 Tax=Metapseudomonas boanensis TaxID=2822138 RepID=A0ABS5XGN5_9GAMM|nr:cysteine-rich CWC family protein [Pseudomonas boanensis]MBT8766856.1 cysteine-rich CWC family protein [Pseudomonas boanensis]